MGAGAIHHPFESGGRPRGNVAGPRGGAQQQREREREYDGWSSEQQARAEVSLWQAVGWREIRDKDSELEEKKQKMKLLSFSNLPPPSSFSRRAMDGACLLPVCVGVCGG